MEQNSQRFAGGEEGIFPTFFMAGFECSTFVWKDGRRRDYVALTGHDRHLEGDYRRVQELGIGVIREAVRWPFVDPGGGRYDWSTLDQVLECVRAYHLTPIWDLCHYGFPDGYDPFSEKAIVRFIDYCRAVAERVVPATRPPRFFTPINEITFFSAGATDMGWMYPFAAGKYEEFQRAMCRLAIEGAKAIREIDPDARMVHVDPMVHAVPPPDRPELALQAWSVEHVQAVASWDMLAGVRCPELGGAPDILDIVGVNVYSFSQAQLDDDGSREVLGPRDPRRASLGEMLLAVWDRYRRPLIIGETSGYQDTRDEWLRMVMEESLRALNSGIDLQGICLYPCVDIPDWQSGQWARIGIYDIHDSKTHARVPCAPYIEELRRWQNVLAHPEQIGPERLRDEHLGLVRLAEVRHCAREWEAKTPGPQGIRVASGDKVQTASQRSDEELETLGGV